MGNFDSLNIVLVKLTENMNKLLDSIPTENYSETPEPQPGDPDFVPPKIYNELGGPIAPNTMSVVGEAGRELIKMGNSGGEVINNTTTEKIMGAANAVVNNIGNDGSDILKEISSTLAQSNQIQSNILKETRRSKGFQY